MRVELGALAWSPHEKSSRSDRGVEVRAAGAGALLGEAEQVKATCVGTESRPKRPLFERTGRALTLAEALF
jgi:hypothetical protein